STLLWQGKLDRAQKTLAYIDDPDFAQMGMTRIRLQRGDSRALASVAQCTANAAQDNGLVFDLARYYRQRGDDASAIRALGRRRAAMDPYDDLWWRERSLLARRALENGNYQGAYNLVKAHGHDGGTELAEAEWLAGWLAVTRLKQPSAAFHHFERMYRNVKTPISIARAAYWAGIAAEQMRDKTLARQYYSYAAQHMNTFYGQLGAYALGNPKASFAAFFRRDRPSRSFSSGALPQDLIGAARILKTMNRPGERDMFLRTALRVATARGQAQNLIQVARELGSTPIALSAAKAAYDKGVLVSDGLFPRAAVPANRNVEAALTLGIIRQESLFDPMAVSRADARGLMQLLPGTARQVARQAGIPYTSDYSLFQPNTNMVLGQEYLARMQARYDNFVPLVAASYNAGPGNVDKWLRSMGDPRKDPYSWVDWVERIPFYETRNYVQRVWEAYSVYQYMQER
ncbi:MAG: lytic murein transglycosylase, partial [Alphaproteobacteria bacterium]|nr:lytic murein transglycosylase [Alphaproteobacteria bacterium]